MIDPTWQRRRRAALAAGAALVVSIPLLTPLARAQSEAPALPPPLIAPTTQPRLADAPTVRVNGFRFSGNTSPTAPTEALLSLAEATLLEVAPDRVVTTDQLEVIRQRLTQYYVDRGFVSSGAELPDQDLEGGIVHFRLVEGGSPAVEVGPALPASTAVGASTQPAPRMRLRESYVLGRLRDAGGTPLNLNRLQDRLELLRQDPNVERVNAELSPAAELGRSLLSVRIAETPPVQLGISFNNHRSVSVGPEILEAFARVQNVSGFGDVLNLRYGITAGGFDQMEFAGLDDLGLDYTLPVAPDDTTITLVLERNSDSVVEEPFADLAIKSESNRIGLTIRRPMWRTPTAELGAFATIEYRENETRLDDDGFSFSPGSDEGKSRVTPLRFGVDAVVSRRQFGFAARSVITVGTNWFTGDGDATPVPPGVSDPTAPDFPDPDAQFIAWLSQAQLVLNLAPRDVSGPAPTLLFRGAAQLANDSLPSLEQFSIGGVNTVRGYRENRVVRDQGLTGTVELHLPLMRRSGGKTALELVPFADAGFAFNRETEPDNSEFISSVGIGAVFTPAEWFSAEVYYGYPLNRFENRDDLQDIGVHFNFTISHRF